MAARRGHTRAAAAYRAPAQKSSREIGRIIREHTGMTPQEYKSYYNRIRNQVRNFERDNLTQGKIDISQFLYDIDRRELRAEKTGYAVQYTQEQKIILNYTSVSTSAPITTARQQRARELLTGENGVFQNLLDQSIYVREKYDEFIQSWYESHDDPPPPSYLNQQLRRWADEIHEKRRSAAGKGASFYNKYGRRDRS